MPQAIFRYSLLVLLSLSLAGCGFALRGTVELPPSLRTLHLEGDLNSDFARELRRSLSGSGVNLVNNAEEAAMRLGIGNERSEERVLSVNANARAGEFELIMTVPFQLSDGEELLLGPETLRLEKVYLTDPENAVAKAEESELIRREMRRELAQMLLRRLQATANSLPPA